MKIGIIVAMSSEFDLVSQILEQSEIKKIKHLTFIEGRFMDKDIILMQSGMGKVCAAAATVEMISNFKPDYIINTGLAGGIDNSLSVMDIVLGAQTVYHDVWCGEGNAYGQVQGLPVQYKADADLLKKALAVKSDVAIHSGLIAGGDKFISDIMELTTIKNQFPEALAVDMESTAIAQVCYLYQVPFLPIRIISDTPGIKNHYEQYLDFWSKAPEKSLEVIKQMLS